MKKKIVVSGLQPAVQKSKPENYLILTHDGEEWQLDDQTVNENNFHKTRKSHPKQMVSLRKFFSTKTVPIGEVKVKEMR